MDLHELLKPYSDCTLESGQKTLARSDTDLIKLNDEQTELPPTRTFRTDMALARIIITARCVDVGQRDMTHSTYRPQPMTWFFSMSVD
jgi:hypothetical protein